MTYIPGDHWVVCDLCGIKYRRSECRFNYRNHLVCGKCWEPRHPQEKGPTTLRERQKVKDPRPEGDGYDVFVEPGETSRDDL